MFNGLRINIVFLNYYPKNSFLLIFIWLSSLHDLAVSNLWQMTYDNCISKLFLVSIAFMYTSSSLSCFVCWYLSIFNCHQSSPCFQFFLNILLHHFFQYLALFQNNFPLVIYLIASFWILHAKGNCIYYSSNTNSEPFCSFFCVFSW